MMTVEHPIEPRDDNFTPNRKRTIKWIVIGYATFALAFATAMLLAPRPDPIAPAIDRLLLALQWTAAPGFVVLVILQGLWRIQDTPDAEDPLANRESRGFKINQRVMTNTIEQAAIFVPIYIAFAIRMSPDQVYWLPLLMVLWSVARLMFWVGYRRGLHYRAPGMDWTSGTTMVTAFLFVRTLF